MKDPNHKSGAEHVAREAGLDQAERLDMLRELFPEAFAEGKVDWDKLRATLGEEVSGSAERYSFSWAGKRDAIRLLQMPSRATLVPVPDESVDWDTTKNVFVEGDNLEVLKLLLKPYHGRVKMIYIDPPYNTGNDFVYPDNYADPLDTYLKLTGQVDSDGNQLTSNRDASGRFHSSWLSMIYPRLFLARQLLTEDGAIYVSIDDNEVHNLRMALNEVFGEENFIAAICWERADSPKMDSDYFSVKHDYILCFAKNAQEFNVRRLPYALDEIPKHFNKVDDSGRRYYLKPLRAMGGQGETRAARPNLYYGIKAPDGTEVFPKLQSGVDGAWRWSQKKLKAEAERIEWVQSGADWTPYFRIYADGNAGLPPETMLFAKDVGSTRSATAELKALFDSEKYFDTPKPLRLLKFLLRITTSGDDLVLDFFAGSGSTGHAVLEQNAEDGEHRNFLLVQIPEPTKNPELPTISAICKARLHRASASIRARQESKLALQEGATEADLGFRSYKLTSSNYKQWTGVAGNDSDEYATQMEAFADPLVDGWKSESVIYEVAIKEGFGLNLSIAKLEDVKSNEVLRVSDPDKGQSFVITLDAKLDPQTVKGLELSKDDLFICRDSALTDEQAANLALQCRLKTV